MIQIAETLEDEWFKKDYIPPQFKQNEDMGLEDLDAAFSSAEVIQSECDSWYVICCPQNLLF
jgi:hypothetical protein